MGTKEKLMATCNANQNEAILKCLASKELYDHAYVVLFDLLNEEEQTAFYQVRYNTKNRLALDFKQWAVQEKDMPNDNRAIYDDTSKFVQAMLNQLMYNFCEDEVIVKRVTIMADGTLCD